MLRNSLESNLGPQQQADYQQPPASQQQMNLQTKQEVPSSEKLGYYDSQLDNHQGNSPNANQANYLSGLLLQNVQINHVSPKESLDRNSNSQENEIPLIQVRSNPNLPSKSPDSLISNSNNNETKFQPPSYNQSSNQILDIFGSNQQMKYANLQSNLSPNRQFGRLPTQEYENFERHQKPELNYTQKEDFEVQEQKERKASQMMYPHFLNLGSHSVKNNQMSNQISLESRMAPQTSKSRGQDQSLQQNIQIRDEMKLQYNSGNKKQPETGNNKAQNNLKQLTEKRESTPNGKLENPTPQVPLLNEIQSSSQISNSNQQKTNIITTPSHRDNPNPGSVGDQIKHEYNQIIQNFQNQLQVSQTSPSLPNTQMSTASLYTNHHQIYNSTEFSNSNNNPSLNSIIQKDKSNSLQSVNQPQISRPPTESESLKDQSRGSTADQMISHHVPIQQKANRISGDSIQISQDPSILLQSGGTGNVSTNTVASKPSYHTPTSNTPNNSTPSQNVLSNFITRVGQGDVLGRLPQTEKSSNQSQPQLFASPGFTQQDSKSKLYVSSARMESNIDKKLQTIQTRQVVSSRDTNSINEENKKLINSSSNNQLTSVESSAQPPQIPNQGEAQLTSSVSSQLIKSNLSKFQYYNSSLETYAKSPNNAEYFNLIFRQHFIQSFHALQFIKKVRKPDLRAIQGKILRLPQKDPTQSQTVVFDLDQTLIHCNQSIDLPYDVVIPIKFPTGETIDAGVNIRPYAFEILKELSKDFEIIVFTASHQCYASKVLDHLDPENQFISYQLFRENCVATDQGVHIKDLRIFGDRDLQDLVLVDNAAYSYGFQIECGIPIIPFYDNQNDLELKHLMEYIQNLQFAPDVRDINQKHFQLHHFFEHDRIETVLDQILGVKVKRLLV